MELDRLAAFLDDLLKIGEFAQDSSNNGLQVQGAAEVRKAVFGVDSSRTLFEKAAERGAQFVFVHHGISWRDSLKRLTGYNKMQVEPLFKNSISLYAAHLPLDAAPKIGHNACLARMLGLRKCGTFAEYSGKDIGVCGAAPSGATAAKFASILDRELSAKCVVFGGSGKTVRNVGVISGGSGSHGIVEALEKNLDCLVTGEVCHESFHLIRETGITVVSGGHYCTEKPGIISVMDILRRKFRLECEFIDLPTGM